ncbi:MULTISPECIES: fasciclin domain-containing protein [unclassified Synechococcus]|uniref:fasciclin domain-containing protein n=1 Tax=unclassified Synechococcus TaxID=2626047 RepID=UPI0039C43DE6
MDCSPPPCDDCCKSNLSGRYPRSLCKKASWGSRNIFFGDFFRFLTYHAVPGKVLSTSLEAGEVVTVEGSPVEISLADGVKVNDANVVTADIEASNGVIHVIDKVILPPQG